VVSHIRFNVRFHVIIFLENYSENDFVKYIPGGYQYRSKSFIFYSDADIFIQKLWKMAIKNIDIFRDLYFGLKRRRLRQGYGQLYNVKVDDADISSDDCIENFFQNLIRNFTTWGSHPMR